MSLLFNLIYIFILSCAFMAVLGLNPVYSLFALILVFLGSACFLFLWGLDFLGFIFLTIYIGAIAILFLFVIMMFNIKPKRPKDIHLYPSVFFLCFFICELYLLIMKKGDTYLIGTVRSLLAGDIAAVAPELISPGHVVPTRHIELLNIQDVSNIEALGIALYGEYFLLLWLIGLVLLIALLGAVSLTKTFKNIKKF